MAKLKPIGIGVDGTKLGSDERSDIKKDWTKKRGNVETNISKC